MDAAIAKACTFYFIHLSEVGLPIPSTMFAKHNNKIDHGLHCREARLSPTQMIVPVGHKACYHKSHFRYFYKVDIRSGAILPNSFFQRVGKPRSMCTSHYRILEYIIYN